MSSRVNDESDNENLAVLNKDLRIYTLYAWLAPRHLPIHLMYIRHGSKYCLFLSDIMSQNTATLYQNDPMP